VQFPRKRDGARETRMFRAAGPRAKFSGVAFVHALEYTVVRLYRSFEGRQPINTPSHPAAPLALIARRSSSGRSRATSARAGAQRMFTEPTRSLERDLLAY